LLKLFQKLAVSKGSHLRQSLWSLSAESETLLGEAQHSFALKGANNVRPLNSFVSNISQKVRTKSALREQRMLRASPLSGEPPHPRRRIGFASKTSTFAIEVC